MLTWLKSLKEKAWIAHLLRANERFTARLGNQFGAAITYFSILAVVPLIMVAFSITGFVLVELRPELLASLQAYLTRTLGQSPGTAQLLDVVNSALSNYASVGVFGLLSALYSGIGWMGNLRDAVLAQWRTDFGVEPLKEKFVRKTLLNLLRLLGLLVAIGITFGMATLSTNLTEVVISALQLQSLTWLSWVLKVVPVVISLATGWVLFVFLYTVLPNERAPWPRVRLGALVGSVGLALLEYLTTFLFAQFAGNPAAILFGPVITLMLFFNLFARLILLVGAWIATFDEAALPARDEPDVRFALTPNPVVEHEPAMVRQEVAERSVRVGLGAGYVTGTATGVGLGAMLAVAAAALRRRRDRD